MKAWNRILERLKVSIEKEMKHETEKAFESKTWDNKSWKRSNKTKKIPTLIDTGKMKNSIKFKTNKKGINVTAIEYAKYQNEGTDTIPSRTFIGKSKELESFAKKQLDIEFKQHFDTVIKDLFKNLKNK